jgi:hypothetical protein
MTTFIKPMTKGYAANKQFGVRRADIRTEIPAEISRPDAKLSTSLI